MLSTTRRYFLLFLLSLVSLSILLSFFVISLTRYLHALHHPLPSHDCMVISAEIIPCPAQLFTVKVLLQPFLPNAPTTAYPFPDSSICPFPTQATAQEFATAYPSNTSAKCYSDGEFVRLIPGPIPRHQLVRRQIHTIWPGVLAGLAAVATVWYATRFGHAYRKRLCRDVEGSLDVSRLRDVMDHVTSPDTAWRTTLCALCGRHLGTGIKLPCGCRFHENCVERWIATGAAKCVQCGKVVEVESLVREQVGESALEVGQRDGWG